MKFFLPLLLAALAPSITDAQAVIQLHGSGTTNPQKCYWDIMDKNLSAAMSGQLTSQEALDQTAEAWEEVTDRLGRDEQLGLYRAAIGYGG